MVRLFICVVATALLAPFALAEDDDDKRQIEEVIVTAERVESTVSDTSISITAVTSEMLEDLGIQSADEFVNFIPATTRDTFDIRIRGVGRNFRSLGGDPGVATYYNDVYSEDALIALTENALFDVERIEVLRGPQGTVYGRNSVGGAVNYITKRPSDETAGLVRVQLGSDANQELYGVLSGPLNVSKGTAGYRLTVSDRERDGWQEGQFGGPDTDSVNDKNYALSVEMDPSDKLSMFMRLNKRNSSRIVGNGMIIDEGWGDFRGTRRTDQYAFGVRSVTAETVGATQFINPKTGVVAYGGDIRPGVDIASSSMPNPAYGSNAYINGAGDFDAVEAESLTNGGTHEGFDQQGAQLTVSYELTDTARLKYIFGYGDFDYTYVLDTDYSNSEMINTGNTVLEDVWNLSHELQLFWDITDNLFLTSGAYFFASDRLQNFTINAYNSQNRVNKAANYGPLGTFLGYMGPQYQNPHLDPEDAVENYTYYGLWGGDPEGDIYRHINTNYIEQTALYSQAEWTLNESWAVKFGLRYAEDNKDVLERRTYYFENWFPFAYIGPDIPALRPAWDGLVAAYGLVNMDTARANGVTDLALVNILMGNATPNFVQSPLAYDPSLPLLNPANPITPTCPLDAVDCDTPLRLEAIPLGGTSLARDSKSWSKLTGRINLDWTPNDQTLVYLSYTTGYRSGGFGLGIADARTATPSKITPLSYDLEEIKHTELGYKGEFFDNTLQLFTSLYIYDYSQYQDQVTVFDPVQLTYREIPTNTGDAINQGWEIEGTWLATDNLTINANYSLTQTEYQDEVLLLIDDDFRAPSALYGVYNYDLTGQNLKGIPEHKAVIWANYSISLPNDSRMNLAAYYSYTGEYNTNSIDRAFDTLPARHQTDVSAIWTNVDGSLTVRAFVDNLFDKRNFRSLGSGGPGNNYRLTGALIRDRNIGIDVTKRFGDI